VFNEIDPRDTTYSSLIAKIYDTKKKYSLEPHWILPILIFKT
jgi:hypothetical protein